MTGTRVLWAHQPGRVGAPIRRGWWRIRRALDPAVPRVWLALLWEPRDLWVGVYWTRPEVEWKRALDVYVCVIPCLPLRVQVRRNARLFGVWGFKA